MILNGLERQFTAVVRFMRVLTKRLRLKLFGCRYKVALYLSYLHVNFDEEIKEIPSNFKQNF